MQKMPVRCLLNVMFSFLVCSKVFAIDVEFYAVESTTVDIGKVSMTQDLLYTQLMSFSGVNVIDKRNTKYNGTTSSASQDVIVLYVIIDEKGTEWICTVNAEQPALHNKTSISNTYNSYYKVLTEAKNSLRQILSDMSGTSTDGTNSVSTTSAVATTTMEPTLDLLSGTWSGEPSINKIVLLRGGRGFVIFNNGASMNIAVDINDGLVTCTQTGKPNASFFPELPREVALVAALNAEPIKWTLTLLDAKTLSGTKESLRVASKNEMTSTVEQAVTSVTWIKQ